ncbi:MAG: glucuronate isomerase [Clostridiales Family XIII bacterium]|jgi:glucuronate isomerase|nr:glucuronate isomerase [Clostridiales Family XIII bacterium]
MKTFMDEDFLLTNRFAERLYHAFAEPLPIIDYHCHIDPADIVQDRSYDSVTDLWLGGDHYKWRLLRANGVPEEELTYAIKDDPWLVFKHFAAALPRAAGNPIYHWSHLELKRYFGIDKPLSPETAEEIYARCNEKLKEASMSARGLIAQSNVKLICTTDDPIDSLDEHRRIDADPTCNVSVLPAFRPEKAMDIRDAGFADYARKLAEVSGVNIIDFPSFCEALDVRIEYFHAVGCRTADHSLDSAIYAESTPSERGAAVSDALNGKPVDAVAAEKFRTAVLLHLGRHYRALGWVMQIHFGVMRNNNARMYEKIGPNTGFDAMNGNGRPERLARFLDALERTGDLPKTVLYSLNPNDSEIIASIAPCFMTDGGIRGKIQLGAAWWFNDTKTGMEKQLTDCANNSLLGNFVGMLTDSRSFLSYVRHEYFRRILCNFIGTLMDNGEYPEDIDMAGGIVRDICYFNTLGFFNFDIEAKE